MVTCLWIITKKTLDKKAKRERKEALRFDKNGPDRTVYGIFLFVYDNRQVLFYVTDDLLVSLIVNTNKHVIWVFNKNQLRRSSSRQMNINETIFFKPIFWRKKIGLGVQKINLAIHVNNNFYKMLNHKLPPNNFQNIV